MMCFRFLIVVLTACIGANAASLLATQQNEVPARTHSRFTWQTNYTTARSLALENDRYLFIYFHEGDSAAGQFESEVLCDPEVAARLSKFELCKLPVDKRIVVEGQEIALLSHGAFTHMHKTPGIALVDFANHQADHYEHVVSAFPFQHGKPYNKEQVLEILGLPPGTITQRTLIYAVRIHPEDPQSADGELNPVLVDAAEWHSQYMADIRLQGHHFWERRFHRLNAQIPASLIPSEVAAESWPGETLVEAAVECVYSWRRSPGHWRGVMGRHPIYGYDMKRGSNGIWYATGVFGQR